MATKLPEWIQAIDTLVGITSTNIADTLGDDPKEFAVKWAHKEHSKHRPQRICVKIDGAGTFDYLLSTTLLSLWSDEFSVIKYVEYPVDDTAKVPDILDDDQWMVYQKPDGYYLRFLEHTPTATEDIRVTYTAIHTISNTANSTVATIDIEAVQQLAASHFCKHLARYFSQTSESSLTVDSIDHKSKAKEYSDRAKELEDYYYLIHLGIKKGQSPPANVNVDWDLKGSWYSDKLTHKKRYR